MVSCPQFCCVKALISYPKSPTTTFSHQFRIPLSAPKRITSMDCCQSRSFQLLMLPFQSPYIPLCRSSSPLYGQRALWASLLYKSSWTTVPVHSVPIIFEKRWQRVAVLGSGQPSLARRAPSYQQRTTWLDLILCIAFWRCERRRDGMRIPEKYMVRQQFRCFS